MFEWDDDMLMHSIINAGSVSFPSINHHRTHHFNQKVITELYAWHCLSSCKQSHRLYSHRKSAKKWLTSLLTWKNLRVKGSKNITSRSHFPPSTGAIRLYNSTLYHLYDAYSFIFSVGRKNRNSRCVHRVQKTRRFRNLQILQQMQILLESNSILHLLKHTDLPALSSLYRTKQTDSFRELFMHRRILAVCACLIKIGHPLVLWFWRFWQSIAAFWHTDKYRKLMKRMQWNHING